MKISFVFPGQNYIKDLIKERSSSVFPSPAWTCILSGSTISYHYDETRENSQKVH